MRGLVVSKVAKETTVPAVDVSCRMMLITGNVVQFVGSSA